MDVWTVSEPKIGTRSQCISIARGFTENPVEKTFEPARKWRRIFDAPLFRRGEREPQLLVSCGFRAEKRVMKIKHAYGGRPFSVHLQEPLIDGYDMIFVSRHDWQPSFEARPNYYQMLGVPHRFTMDFWRDQRLRAREILAPAGEKVVAMFLGGSNGAYLYDDATHLRIKNTVTQLTDDGWKVLISVSRRSSPQTLGEILPLASEKVIVWDRISDNPFIEYMAAADAFLIAKDSVTMPCEALSTGMPVYSLDLTEIPGERLEKFERYHSDLQDTLSLTRAYRGEISAYDYTPPTEAQRITEIIRQSLL